MTVPTSRDDRRPPFARALACLVAIVVISVVMGVLTAGLAIPFAGLAGLTTRSVAQTVSKLPMDLTTEPMPERSRVLTGSGKVLATFYDQNRVIVGLDRVAPVMKKSIVAIEDARFYEHGAIDLKGTLRAFVTNQTSDQVVQGGSSITQQLVKMTLQDQADTEEEREAATAQTYRRKFDELRYAKALESDHEKRWILEQYLNRAYFGDGAYGIEVAARHYFSRPASRLRLHQAALLAGLVKNPTGYDPTNRPGAALRRRNVVLNRMAELEVVTGREARKAKARPLGLKVTRTSNGCVSSRAPFFCDYVHEYLLTDPRLGRTREERERKLRTGGLEVRTTVDLRMQRAAQRSVRRHVFAKDRAIGALALVQPGTGKVRAIAQSRPMGTKKRKGETFLNYVVPAKYGDANGFQAGSTFKVFVLAAAIKQGIKLRTRIKAPPQVSIPVSEFEGCRGPLRSTDRWEPRNSTGSGTFNLYTGTQQSVNTFFAKLEKRTGLCTPYRLAKRMGIDLRDPDNQQVPAFTLGVVDTNPLAMAEAYATFASRGMHCDSRPVTRVLDRHRKTLARYPKRCNRVLRKEEADAVSDVLRGVQEPGGFGHSAGISLNQPSAGKTGTINNNMAVWFVGYTPNLSAAAMLAGANQQGHWKTLNGQTVGGRYISQAHGSTNAGPIWGDAMQVIQRWLPDLGFVKPPKQLLGKPPKPKPTSETTSDDGSQNPDSSPPDGGTGGGGGGTGGGGSGGTDARPGNGNGRGNGRGRR